MKLVPFLNEHRPGRSIDQQDQRLINWYLHPFKPGGNPVDSWVLYPTNGNQLFFTTLANSTRGALVVDNTPYIIYGGTFATVSSAGIITVLGTLSSSVGRCSLASTGGQVGIVDGVHGYIYDVDTSTFTQIGDADFPNGASTITAQDGYFIVEVPNSQQFAQSNLNNGLVWTALGSTNVAGRDTDNLIAVKSYSGDLYLFGRNTIEVWWNSGVSSTNPFERREATTWQYGCQAKDSIAESSDSLCWLARTRFGGIVPLRMTALQPKPIFNPDICDEISRLEITSDAFAWVEAEGTHEFYVLTFPTEGKTYVYDLTYEVSHMRQSTVVPGVQGVHNANIYFSFDGRKFFGDKSSGNFYEIMSSVYTDLGQYITRELQTGVLFESNENFYIDNFQVFFDTNAALLEGQGSNPKVALSFSFNGGHTYGPELIRSIGTSGQFNDVARWSRVGRGRKVTIKMAVTDPIRWIVRGAGADTSMEIIQE